MRRAPSDASRCSTAGSARPPDRGAWRRTADCAIIRSVACAEGAIVRSSVLGILLLTAVIWLLGVRSTAPGQVAVYVQAGTASAEWTRTNPPANAYQVFHAHRLASVLSRFSELAPAAEVRRLRAEVDTACRALVLLELDGRREADPRRADAQAELRARCAELPVPSMYVPMAATRMPTEEDADPAAAVAALAELRRARHREHLAAAWLDAYAQDALPQDRIFPDRRRLLPAEAESLIHVVIDWRECARVNACDADSLFALRICALQGCTPGSDVQSAWHQALSPRDYESARAIHEWLSHWQAGAGQ